MKSITKRRISAALFDDFICFIILVVILTTIIITSQLEELATIESVDDYDATIITTGSIITNIFLTLIYYSVIPYFTGGATPGKLLASIKTVSANGSKPDIISLLKRNIRFLFALISGVMLTISSLTDYTSILNLIAWGFYTATFITMFNNNGNIALTDKLGDTQVIYTNNISKISKPSNII